MRIHINWEEIAARAAESWFYKNANSEERAAILSAGLIERALSMFQEGEASRVQMTDLGAVELAYPPPLIAATKKHVPRWRLARYRLAPLSLIPRGRRFRQTGDLREDLHRSARALFEILRLLDSEPHSTIYVKAGTCHIQSWPESFFGSRDGTVHICAASAKVPT